MKNLIVAALFVAFLSQGVFAGQQPVKDAVLGVTTTPVSEASATNSKSKVMNGVVVTEVTLQSIAADLGLKKDDIIQTVNEQDIINAEQLAVIMKSFKPGDAIVMDIARNGKSMTLRGKVHAHS